METDYKKYRGKCKEMSEALVKNDPTLRLVRGHYYEPLWNRDEAHWWCEDKDGNIIDPTKNQFPTKGASTYTEFDGTASCENCGVEVLEKDFKMAGNYVCCSNKCRMRLVGL